MERFFQITAAVFAGIAAFFLYKGDAEGTFVAAVLGAVSFFLSIRFQVKGRLQEREAERLEQERLLESNLPAEDFNEHQTTDNEQKVNL